MGVEYLNSQSLSVLQHDKEPREFVKNYFADHVYRGRIEGTHSCWEIYSKRDEKEREEGCASNQDRKVSVRFFSFPNLRGASTNILMTQEIHHAFKETFICKYKIIGNDCPGKSQGTPKA